MPLSADWPILKRDMGARSSRIGGADSSFAQPVIMATVLGALFLAGAAIGALSLVLPHPSEYDS